MTSRIDARNALGDLFIIGFNGLELSPETSNFLTECRIGGVLLFAHNFHSPAQMAELTNQVQESRADLPLWVSADHEGGKVQRFKKGFTRIPDATSIGAMESPKLAFEIAEVMAKELKAVGVNLNFCPVTDIATNPKNPVIGNRSFGATEQLVSKMSSAMVRGHIIHGVMPCIKHFPGHGDTSTDSHFALPRIDNPLEVLQEREFIPFMKAFKSKCSLVMTAHILNSKLDPKYPATLSRYILQDILRKQLRYEKLIVSDDMEMKAITEHFGAEDAPRMAIEAGCDLLIYRSENAGRLAYEALLRAIDDGKLDPKIVLAAQDRIREIKKEFLPVFQPTSVSDVGLKIGIPEHLAVVQKVVTS